MDKKSIRFLSPKRQESSFLSRSYVQQDERTTYHLRAAIWSLLSWQLAHAQTLFSPVNDDTARFKFHSCVILWTNHNFLPSIATNQFASFCADNIHYLKVLFSCLTKWRNLKDKGCSSTYKTNRFHVAVRLFSSRCTATYGIYLLNIVHRGIRPAKRTGSECVPFLRTLVALQSMSHRSKRKARKTK